MGKKSRLKRERRAGIAPLAIFGSDRPGAASHDAEFERQRDTLRRFFCQFDPVDVVLSLGISELWRPNRSSQVKHQFALAVALSTTSTEFTAAKQLGTYEQFSEFLGELQRLLPAFPSLEDFVPEPDWGEVHLATAAGFEPIFYGCSVERIPDFIEAFRLLKADAPQALADMNLAIAMQAHVIRSVPSEIVGRADDVQPGYVETPAAEFWAACRGALLSADATFVAFSSLGTSNALTIELGALGFPRTWGAFGDAVMTGAVLPHVAVRVGRTYLPVSLRSATTVVVDLWTSSSRSTPKEWFLDLDRRVGSFLSARFRQGKVIAGPIRVVAEGQEFDGHVAAVISSRTTFHFVLLMTPEELPNLGNLERKLKRLVDSGGRWGLALPDVAQIAEFRRSDGRQPRSEDIQIVAVLARVTTQATALRLPVTDARVIGMPDFISIFDSLKDIEELEKFWTYLDGIESMLGGFSGPADHFASFRDSNALLIEGAITPNFISLDPHWNSNWRYKELKGFWKRAPRFFPDDSVAWVVDEKGDGLTCLKAKGPLTLAWSGTAGESTFQALMEVNADDPDIENGRLLELFVHCLVDAVTQRGELLSGLELFRREHIVLRCQANSATLVSLIDKDATRRRADLPLLSDWRVELAQTSKKLVVAVAVNLARLHARLERAKDASFEAECAIEAVQGLCALLRLQPDEAIVEQLRKTASRLPRFTTHTTERRVDVPDFAEPMVPEPEHYKVARRDLAVVLKAQGVAAPARYELDEAKLIINAARDVARERIHAQVAQIDRRGLLRFCIEQHDELVAKYQQKVTRLKLSLSHEVSFDRAAALAEAHEEFTNTARNYRYLLECCLSAPGGGGAPFDPSKAVELIAAVDWLLVLYGASDTLHNDIDVGGIELNDSFVPTVYFSEGRQQKERDYLQETANSRLGVGLLEEDEVNSPSEDVENWEPLDKALLADVGFALRHLVQTLHVLSRWYSAGGSPSLQFIYMATPAALVDLLVKNITNLDEESAQRVISFLTLEPAGVRRLAGKDEDEPDIPVWEHNKRVHRYLVRPLVPIDQNLLAWGAATVDRVSSIWTGCVLDGYLPADFQWPKTVHAVRDVKEGIEKELEVRAKQVCLRTTPYVMHGVDFRRRFPKERFDDVGDYDVLAYWPAHNLWLSIECKYNQPPYCLKDARRLRERIFGDDKNRGQFSKIERRRAFLAANVERLRRLLLWPQAQPGVELVLREAYVCRDIYWWMRQPPYPVPTEFVRIDALDAWLRALLGLGQDQQPPGEPQSAKAPAQPV